MDNARTHNPEKVREIVESFGAIVIFLPPYAFKLTPLDNGAFGLVVRYLQRHFARLSEATNAQDVRVALNEAFLKAVDGKGVEACMGNCGYMHPFQCPY